MIFLFDKFKKLKGTVRNRHTISLLYERERNGLYTVSAEIPLKITDKKTVYNYHKKVKDSDFLGHYDREGRFQLHKIASVDIEDSSIFIKGVHLFFDEAKAGAIIQERRFRQSEIIDGARVAFDSIGWSVVDFDVSGTEDYIFYNVSPLEARAILVETFGFEFDYWLDFDGKNIRNKQISVKREMGKDSNKRYNYGHNVLNIKVEQDYSEIYTAVIGRGKGEDLGDDAYGRRIEYTDVVWKTPTNPMNKPKGSRTLHDENATQLFGYHEDGKVSPRTKVEIFEDIEDPAELLQASYEWLKENSVPKAVFSLKVPDGDGLDLGDKVHVIYRDIDLVKHTRVTRVIDDLVSGNRDVEFGDTAYFKTDRRLSGVKSELKRVGGSMSSRISRLKAEFDKRFDDEVQQWKDDFEQALIDAEANVEAMRAEMTEEFEAAQKAFEVQFNQSVSDAKKHADAVADAKAKEVQGNLDSFAGRHEQFVGELQGNIVDIDGSISGIKGSLTEIEGTLTNTKTQLESQITDARTELEKSISDARAEIEGLEVGGRNYIKDSKVIPMTSADSGGRDNTEHISTDDYIEIKSNKDFQSYWYRYYAINTSNRISDESIFVYDSDYQTFGIDILTESDNFEMYINQRQTDHSNSYSSDTISLPNTNGKWQRIYITLPLKHDGLQRSVFYVFISGGKASNPNAFLTNDYIRLKKSKLEKGNKGTDWTPAPEDTEQKITNINQTITNIEGELSSKVEQTEVDALKGTVERQGTLLTQTANEVSSKAEKSVVDTLTGRVANTESSVTQNASEIAKKLTKSVYDSDKKATDAEITKWSNLTTETAEGLEQTISRVSTAEGKLSDAELSIKANADSLKLTATKTEVENAIDGIKVGGRNLLLNSNIRYETSGYNIADYPLTETIPEGTEVTISIKGQLNSKKSYFGVYNSGGSVQTATLRPESQNSDGVYVGTFKWRAGSTSNTFLRVYHMPSSVKDVVSSIDWVKLEYGNKATSWTPAPEDTDAKITKVSSDLEVEAGRIEGLVTDISKDYVKQSSVKVTSDRVTIGSTSIDGDTLSSVISVSPTAIDLISDKINVTGNVNISGGVTALAVDAIEGNFSRLFASSLTTNVIKSNHVQTDTAFAKKLFATNANINELTTRTHFSNSIKTLSIDAVHADLRSVNSEIMTSNIIKSKWLNVDNAIVNRIISRQFFTDNAVIKAANIRDLTAIDIKGGILSALNGNYTQNLNTGITDYYGNALIHFHDENNRLRMTHQGHIMEIGTKRGTTSPIFYMGGHRNLTGQVEPNDYGFTGLKTISDINRADVIGDRVYIAEGGQQNAMAVSFDYSTAISNRTAFIMPVRRDSSDSYYIGNLNTWFDGVFTHRLSGLDIYRDPSTHNVDIGRALSSYPTSAPRLNFRPDDIWYKDSGGTVSIKERLAYAKSAYDRVFVGNNSVEEQIRSLAGRIYALERK